MMKRLAAMLILLLAVSSAEARRGDGSGVYFGGGMLRSISTFKSQTTSSNFAGWGGTVQVGVDFSDETSGPFLEAEYGRTDLINSFSNSTYLEKATNSYLGAQAGFRINAFSLSGGARQNEITVDNVATLGNSGRNTFSGLSYFGALRVTVNDRDSVRTFIEISHTVGTLGTLELSETQGSLKIVFSPF